MSTPTRLIKAVVKRLERLERIRAIMHDGFESTGSGKDRLRRDVVTAHVADAIKCEVSPKLRATVLLLGRQLGWRTMMVGNVALFGAVKKR